MNTKKEKYILAFPGQGSQFVGMGEGIAQASNSAYAVYRLANEILGFDLMRHCFEDPEGRLTGDRSKNIRPDTRIIQPAIVATGLAITAMMREGGVTEEQFAAGHRRLRGNDRHKKRERPIGSFPLFGD
jgi:[acyl-carrier-protein] S-malonyltransferase